MQEEGATLGTPVLVTRWTTERPEGDDVGALVLVGTDREHIRRPMVLGHDAARQDRVRAAGVTLYGDGHAAGRIIEIISRDTGG
jgi:UDP-N-acetylglucosamine 2-epimerase (non-hydrolysing)